MPPKTLTFPPSQKLLDENRNRLFSIAGKVEKNLVEKIDMPLTHLTTVDRVEAILRSGELRSIAKQESLWGGVDRINANTDALDREHGFDKYVFTTLARNATHNGGEIAFVFPASDVLEKPGVLFNLKEVADYGAMVSPEAEAVFRARTGKSPKARNDKAVREFFDNVVRWTDAPRIMTAFLQKHYNEYVDYLLSLTYPGEKLSVMPETGTHNVWGGPQCMVPDSLALDECAYVLAPNRETKAFIEEKMVETGTALNVKCIEECSPLAVPPPPGTDNFMRAFNMLTYQIPSRRPSAK